jgi:hypothetical protein
MNYCHEYENNQDKRIFKRHKQTMTKVGLVWSLSVKHLNKYKNTQRVQDIGSNAILLWKHEKSKTRSWCKTIP